MRQAAAIARRAQTRRDACASQAIAGRENQPGSGFRVIFMILD
jgi:hypothetical protein